MFSSLSDGISVEKIYFYQKMLSTAIKAIKQLGIKVNLNKNYCKIYGKGIDGFKYKKNLKINAQNSGTLGRLILGLLVNSPYPIKIIGDKSLSKEILIE